jgi:hypothetical protein
MIPWQAWISLCRRTVDRERFVKGRFDCLSSMQEWRKRKQNKAIGSGGKILPDTEHVNNPFMKRLPFDVQIFHGRAGLLIITAVSS